MLLEVKGRLGKCGMHAAIVADAVIPRTAMDTIWTGLVAGAVAAVVTLATHFLTQRHEMNLLKRGFEHQTRAALRETYDKLLVTQRRSRDASVRCAKISGGVNESSTDEALAEAATAAYTTFIEHYHQLNLDASRQMWIEARGLRHVLDDLLAAAHNHDAEKADQLAALARDARQNLERSFRLRLGHEVLQARRVLPSPYDKAEHAQGREVEDSRDGRRG